MPSRCTAYKCSNNSNDGYALVTYPQNESLRQKWIAAVGRGKSWSPNNTQKLCEIHFQPSEIKFVAGHKQVKLGAVPSRFCTCSIRKKRNILHLHQDGCVQTCKPLTKENVQPTTSQEIVEQMDEIQPMDENANSPRSIIIKENEQLRNEMKGTVEEVVKVNEKTERIDVEVVDTNVYEENYKLKQQVKVLNERLQLTQKVLAEDQWTALKTGQSRGLKWSKETVLKGLALRFTCGTTGYNYVREVVAPFPSVRTLQRSIENISFEPGVLTDIFALLKEMGEHLDEIHKFCCLVFDEMSIREKIDFDWNSKTYIGYTTLPGLPRTIASKLMAFLLSGVCKRWKQIVAYHFTPLQTHNKSIKEIILNILEQCERNGLVVICLVCDMGNRGILNELGFSCRKNKMVYSIPHPFNSSRNLYAIPDFIHTFKNLKEMLMKVGVILLPEDVVNKYNLQSQAVDMRYVKWLEDKQSDMDLKFNPNLKKKDLKPNHFNKMKVTPATNTISPQTAGALFRLSETMNDSVMETTAWFILMLRHLFKIMTSRDRLFALSFNKMNCYHTAIETIRLFISIFRNATIEGDWKVTLTHMIMCLEAILEIQEMLLQTKSLDIYV
ncbi:uncharacterized protein [Temnothorax longispinosus]|uniref:uncharacterized protein n=1 Tax=Temnothorax longispinosus TaxID=300112 RepID=UPI003A9981B6